MYDKDKYLKILSNKIAVDGNSILLKVAKGDFNRIVSDFQVLPFEEKIKQNAYTSIGVRFGHAMEDIVKEFLKDNGAIFLPRNIVTINNKIKDCDQIFQYKDKTILIEQKVRDDHDSAKKYGQLNNFLEKKNFLKNTYPNVLCCSWFIDETFSHNKAYYKSNLTDPCELCYGSEIEDFLSLVFEDNRCDNLVNNLKETIKIFKENLSVEQNFDNAVLDYTNPDLKLPQLFAVISNEKYKNEVAHFFFDGTIPYEDILAYVKTKNWSSTKIKLIDYLERKIKENE